MANSVVTLLNAVSATATSNSLDPSEATRVLFYVDDSFDAKVYIMVSHDDSLYLDIPIRDALTGTTKRFISGPGFYTAGDPRCFDFMRAQVRDYVSGTITLEAITSDVLAGGDGGSGFGSGGGGGGGRI